ncbi:MAG: acyl carrier protein [Candidatus Riflebacteria bacterium]|nr:acyl carrier protein [Candidatus Riflebacteria bacterium]
MTKADFLRNLEIVVEAPPNSISVGQPLLDLSGWDSMAIIAFIAFADEKLGKSVQPESLEKAKTVDDLALLVGII